MSGLQGFVFCVLCFVFLEVYFSDTQSISSYKDLTYSFLSLLKAPWPF